MKVNININYEKFVFTCGIDNLEYSDKFFASNRSEFLYSKIKDELGLEKSDFYLKYNDFELVDDENLSKILDESEDIIIDFYWNDLLCLLVKIEIEGYIFSLPRRIANESNLIKSLEQNIEEGKLVLKNDFFNNKFIINDWMRLSKKINKFMKDEKIDSIYIPTPIIPISIVDENNKILEKYIGKEATDFLNTLKIDRLRDLAKAFDYLQIENLLNAVCANIAVRFAFNKDIKDFKKLAI